MKILLLCHKMPFPPNDGGAIATLNMVTGFANQGDEVTVLAMQTHKHFFNIEELPNDIKKQINWNTVKINTKLNPISAFFNLLFSKKPYNAIRFESKKFKDKLQELLLQNSYDIIQLEGLYLYSYIETIKIFSKALISLRAHNIEHEIWERLAKNESLPIKKQYLKLLAKRVKLLEKSVLDKIDLLIPITKRDAGYLKIGDTSRVHVSPTGMDNSKFNRLIPVNKKTLFYIGALDWIPNQEAIIWFINNVWSKVKSEFSDWDFVIAGRNAPPNFVHEFKRYPIKYIGEVESATDFIDSHNIMVVPLLSGSGMRIKIIEGMARGKCIVTTKIGAEGIPAENKKEIFIQDSAIEFKRVLKKLIQNHDQIEECGKNAFIFVKQNYNNSNIITELRNFYTKHIGNS